jgi:hypothetical protein
MGTDKPNKTEQSALSALQSPELTALIQRAQDVATLDQCLRQHLPEPLAKQCRLANWSPEKLVFHVSNPVWKNKLRLHSQVILAAAKARGLHARIIIIKVNPAFNADSNR